MFRVPIFAAAFAVAAAIGVAADSSSQVPIVLVSRQLARDARLAVGDLLVLAADPSGARSMPFHVAGVFEPVPDPMKFNVERYEVRLHLPDLIALTADRSDPQASEAVTAINVKLADPARLDVVARAISRSEERRGGKAG